MNEDDAKDSPKPDAAAETAAPRPANDDTPIDTAADDPAEKSGWEKGPEADAAMLQAENDELRDRMLRLMAEMENMRRRAEREKEESRKYAVTTFARDILAVGDNMSRAIQSIDEDAKAVADQAVKNLIEGVEMTEREMLNVFDRHGIKRIEPEGEKFDPNFHQAMFEAENPDVASGTVIQVVQPGYVIGERVLRPAMVGVSKGGPKAPAAPEPSGAPAQPDDKAQAEAESTAEAQAAAKSHEDAARAKTAGPSGKTVDRNA